MPSYRGDSVPLALSAELHRGLLALAREDGATLFMVLQAGFAALLHPAGRGQRHPVGTPIAGRTDGALDDLVGFFVNTLVLRTDMSGDPSFRELLARVRATNLARLRPPGRAVRAAGGGAQPGAVAVAPPAVPGDARAAEHRAGERSSCPGLTASVEPVRDARSAKFDLSLSLGEQRGADGTPAGIRGRARVRHRPVRPRDASRRWRAGSSGCWRRRSLTPDRAIGEPATFSPPTERAHASCAEWNDTARAVRASRRSPELFAAQAARTPDAIAVVFEERALTYARARARAPTGWRTSCVALGVGPEVLVGLCVARSLELVVALLGVLKAGGAYVPLDPTTRPSGCAYMLARRRRAACWSPSALLDRALAGPGRRRCACDADRDDDRREHACDRPGRPLRAATHLAYVIYTSGSTGRPKGCRRHPSGVCQSAALACRVHTG